MSGHEVCVRLGWCLWAASRVWRWLRKIPWGIARRRYWYLLYPVDPEVHRQALGPAGLGRYGRGRNGCGWGRGGCGSWWIGPLEAVSFRPVAGVCRELGAAVGTGRAVGEGGCQSFPDRNAGLICRVAGRVYWQVWRVRRRFPGIVVLVILVWDVA